MGERESRQVAEHARQQDWRGRGFLKEVFLGNLHVPWIDPFPKTELRSEAHAFLERLRAFLEQEVDSAEIDRSGEYPPAVIERLRGLGAFGMKISSRYGGLGFNAVEYAAAIELCARYDANIVALLSAHQSIGVPQPLELFGTEEQKERYLPRCARGSVSAFALTEADVGSDPASLSTTATRQPDGSYLLDGEKLWCTNGTIAELFVVMARDPESRKISAFVVESSWEGVEVGLRCRFMGLRAIENGVIRFAQVRVPAENLIGKEGAGLRIALATLNTGRLSLPAACVGFTKRCTEIVRHYGNERVQWGRPIGRHEAVAHKIATIGATTYAIESMTRLATELALRDEHDIRLEAAAAKEWATVQGWRIVDETMQIRGGRGYETEQSLRARGEPPIPVERMMRDVRINLIFEGSSEIMHLFMAREAVDEHLARAGALIDPEKSWREKLAALLAILFFYAWWYPSRWIGFTRWPRYRRFGPLAPQLRFCERATRRLARAVFHGMVRFGPGLERRQAFLFRLVDVANEIFAIVASAVRAHALAERRSPDARSAAELADAFARLSRRRITSLFRALWSNDDARITAFSRGIEEGHHLWLEAFEPLGAGPLEDRDSSAVPASPRGDRPLTERELPSPPARGAREQTNGARAPRP